MDMFVVPTISFRLLYGLVILRHSRRELLWLGVTVHPNAEWIARQLTEACGWNELPRYIIRDRDRAYGAAFIRRLGAMGIRDRPISARSPWQNGYAERLIGSIRQECLDHVVVFGEWHLRHLLKSYQNYYNEVRTHLSLQKDAPARRDICRAGRIRSIPVLGGLHHRSNLSFRQGQVTLRAKKTQKFALRSALRPNQFSFSHRLGPLRRTQLVRFRSGAAIEGGRGAGPEHRRWPAPARSRFRQDRGLVRLSTKPSYPRAIPPVPPRRHASPLRPYMIFGRDRVGHRGRGRAGGAPGGPGNDAAVGAGAQIHAMAQLTGRRLP
jgi:Integrase core domain